MKQLLSNGGYYGASQQLRSMFCKVLRGRARGAGLGSESERRPFSPPGLGTGARDAADA